MKDLGCTPVDEHSFSSEVSAELSRPSFCTRSLGYVQRQSLPCPFGCGGNGTRRLAHCFSDLYAARAEMPLEFVRPISFLSPPKHPSKSQAFRFGPTLLFRGSPTMRDILTALVGGLLKEKIIQ